MCRRYDLALSRMVGHRVNSRTLCGQVKEQEMLLRQQPAAENKSFLGRFRHNTRLQELREVAQRQIVELEQQVLDVINSNSDVQAELLLRCKEQVDGQWRRVSMPLSAPFQVLPRRIHATPCRAGRGHARCLPRAPCAACAGVRRVNVDPCGRRCSVPWRMGRLSRRHMRCRCG